MKKDTKHLTVLDTFAGAGGFSLGFQLANYQVLGAIELDKWACETFAYNHPDVLTLQRDISQISNSELLELFGESKLDIVIGGPPCQGFSKANRNAGDIKDPRNSLFKEFLRIGEVLKPSIMVMENVPNLIKAKTADGGNVLTIIKESLNKLGFYTYSDVLQAIDYGIPQIRRRLFVIASREPLENPFPRPTHTSQGGETLPLLNMEMPRCPTLWDAISDLPELNAGEGGEELTFAKLPLNQYQAMLRNGTEKLLNHKAMNHSKRMIERFATIRCGDSGNDVPDHLKPRKRNSEELAKDGYDQNNRRMHPDRPCHTIAASFYANFVHPFQHRNFTAREGARIQSFPDWYRFMGKPTVVSHALLARENRDEEKYLCQYNQIGNAVPPLLAKVVALNLKNQLKKANNVCSWEQSPSERDTSVKIC